MKHHTHNYDTNANEVGDAPPDSGHFGIHGAARRYLAPASSSFNCKFHKLSIFPYVNYVQEAINLGKIATGTVTRKLKV
jgi:hypothetical protein